MKSCPQSGPALLFLIVERKSWGPVPGEVPAETRAGAEQAAVACSVYTQPAL